jgi:3-oxoadipate enol-lactonase/4-carboxymuconolactone decarboxylase
MSEANFAPIAGGHLHYRLDGRAGAPVLVLSNSLGTTLEMWAPQMPALLEQFQVLRYDTRGHGQSSVTPGPYSIAQLGHDFLALLDHLGLARANFCGLSMGGMTGIWLGVHHPERIERLVLCNTAAKIGTAELWEARIAAVRGLGMEGIVPGVVDRWFSAGFQARAPQAIAQVRAMLLATSVDGYAANCGAIRDMDQVAAVAGIKLPTLVIAGTHDLATPAEQGRAIAGAIAGARYVELDASHLSNWEQAGAFTAALIGFLSDGMHERARFEAGMSVRRAVLGDAHVDRAQASRNDLNNEFQDFITRTAWGEIWTRPGLTRHTRSLLTIAMMVALNRPDELRLHLRAAANNGVSRDQIREVLLQAAVYCGVPAANAAFHLAQTVFAEQDQAPPA